MQGRLVKCEENLCGREEELTSQEGRKDERMGGKIK